VSSLPCVVRLAHCVVLLLGVSLSARSATAPTASDLAHCAAITAPDARLACYDSLSGAPNRTPATAAPPSAGAGATGASTAPVPTAPAPAAVTTAVSAPAPASTVSATRVPVAAAAPASAPMPAPATPTAALNDPRHFGLNPAQLHAPPPGPQSIQARVANISRNRTGTAYLALDNGQTWTYTDEDSRLGPGDLVTIKRAVLGSFLMTTPSKRSYHVQRVQ
jgi:hypothetical protein